MLWCGDITAGKAFLEQLTPFIWRQNLDFRAIDELADLKTRINQEHPALSHERAAPSPVTANLSHFNVKLGRGGIREIEFNANAQQLLWGGKHYALRTTNTLNALQSLSDLQLMPAQDCIKLAQIYKQLRRLENAIQMVDNAHSHLVPEFGNTRDILARLLGISDWQAYSAHRDSSKSASKNS